MNALNTIFDLFKAKGNADYIGENVSQQEHMIQSAVFAEKNKYCDEVIVAALLHDIGHLFTDAEQMDKFGTKDHEYIGANYLEKLGFEKKVTELIRNHVRSKRYLVSTNINYYQALSDASRKTFEFQGGFMSSEELHDFENSPYFGNSLLVRKCDEAAKIENMELPSLESFTEKCLQFISKKIETKECL